MLNIPGRGHSVHEGAVPQVLFPEQSIEFHSQYIFHVFFFLIKMKQNTRVG